MKMCLCQTQAVVAQKLWGIASASRIGYTEHKKKKQTKNSPAPAKQWVSI
jgi:hypothetical protein